MDLNKYLSELEYLVNIDSGSENHAGLRKMADFFSERFTELGWNVKEFDFTPSPGVCVVCTNREAEHYDLMLIGHLDTVFPEGTAAERPFKLEGNMAYGPGVADMKHGCLLMYHILKELPEEINDKLNIIAVFNPDEEFGSMKSREVYKEYAEKSDYVYLYEACSKNGEHCIERKGGIFFTVDFTGKDGHCGYVFTNGSRSAVSEMARWIVKLDELQSEERNTTVNVGVVQGGTKSNIVPAHASMKVDIRFSMPDEVERVEKTLEVLMKEAEEHQIGIEINKRVKPALVPTDKGKAYIKHIEELMKSLGKEFKHSPRGGHSDANIIAQYGPVCIDGMGPMGSDAHRPEEQMYIDDVVPSFELSNILIRDLADRK